MKKMVRGAIAILALSGLSACVDDPIAPINGAPDRIQANPSVMWVKQGDSSAVLLRLINEANNSTPTTFTTSNVGAGIAINLDTKYRPEYVNGSDTLIVPEVKSQQRYFIRGLAPGEWNYTITSQGITGTFKVRVEPANLGAALSVTTANVGGSVIITSPANTKFTQTATVSFPGGSSTVAARSADGKTITVLVGPNINGPATVAGVTLDYFPTLAALTLASTNNLVTPVVTAAPTTVSNATPSLGAPVVVTLGTGLKFTSTSTVTIGGVASYITGRSADSSAATVVPVGNSAGAVAFTNIVYGVVNTINLALPSDGKTITVAPIVADPNASAFGTAPTFTLPPVGTMAVLSGAGGASFAAGGPCSLGGIGANRCSYYKVTLAAPLRVDASLTWTSTTSADLGLYLVNDLGTTSSLIADGFGAQTGGTESTGAAGFLIPAGTSYIVVAHYGAIGALPTFFQARITGRD